MRKISWRELCVVAGMLGYIAGCSGGTTPEQDAKPPAPMTPEQLKEASAKVEAGRGQMGPAGLPKK